MNELRRAGAELALERREVVAPDVLGKRRKDVVPDRREAAGQLRESQGARVRAERTVLDLAEMRYRGGVSAYLEVLDAQRSLFNSELDEASALGGHLVSLVRLYKALGGGWPQSPEPPPTVTTTTQTK